MAYSRGRCLLQDWLDRRELTQTEFAIRSGWSKRMVSHFCNRTRMMSVEAMYTASLILGCTMEELYEWVPD